MTGDLARWRQTRAGRADGGGEHAPHGQEIWYDSLREYQWQSFLCERGALRRKRERERERERERKRGRRSIERHHAMI